MDEKMMTYAEYCARASRRWGETLEERQENIKRHFAEILANSPDVDDEPVQWPTLSAADVPTLNDV